MKTTADILVLLISMVALLSCNQRNSANGTNRDWDSDKKLVAQMIPLHCIFKSSILQRMNLISRRLHYG